MANDTKNPVPATGIENADELKAINAAQEEQIKDLLESQAALKAKLVEVAKTGKPVSTEPTEFKLGKETYPFPAPKFHVPGHGTLTATEALKRPEVLKYLVEIKAGNID